MALNRMASALADASSVYDTDNDPEFVRLAAPSTLKTIEMLLSAVAQAPAAAADGVQRLHPVLLRVPPRRGGGPGRRTPRRRSDLKARAGKMYQRARGYCLRGLEVRHPGLTRAALAADPAAALKATKVEDVPWLYWTAASWGADLSLAPNQFARIAELASRPRAAEPRQGARRHAGSAARSTRR